MTIRQLHLWEICTLTEDEITLSCAEILKSVMRLAVRDLRFRTLRADASRWLCADCDEDEDVLVLLGIDGDRFEELLEGANADN